MALPPRHNPVFRPIQGEDLPECLQPFASHVYISVAYSPGPPGQAFTTAIELYFDLTSDDMPVEEQRKWQSLLNSNRDLHLASSKHRSMFENRRDVFRQLDERLANKPKVDG